MRDFHNEKENIVTQALDGLVMASGGTLKRFSPNHRARVVLRADWDKSKVAIVSGGGSGHEPAHAGLVGQGLLTAAVCGEVFASPSVDAVLAAIVAVTGAPGCLLVVKNYTGDRLNFGLAAEKAKSLGLKVEMVIVADDVAIPGAPRPRGVAGTVFVHKIAGYMSEAGKPLPAIVQAIERAKPGIFTIGAARDTCTVPGSPKQQRIAPDEVEIGLGIHGEPGVELARVATSRALMADLVAKLRPSMQPDARYALLFNNLGGLSGLECMVLLGDMMQSDIAGQIAYIAGPAHVMTALDMAGFSLSLLALTAELETILTAPTGCPALPPFRPVAAVALAEAPVIASGETHVPSADPIVRRVLETIVATCIGMEGPLNALDAKVGDGDTGSTFASAARAMRQSLDDLPFADGAALLSALSDIARQAMGGSSGVLLAIFLANGAEARRQGGDWVGAFNSGFDALRKYGGANLGDRTLLDALRPALDGLTAGGDLQKAAVLARKGADATAGMLHAGAGRSAYLEARSLAGINDPGAEAVARMFEALAGVKL